MEFNRDRGFTLGNMNQASHILNDGSPKGKRKKAAAEVNYHTMTNNAIFPTDEMPDVIHYTTKKHAGDHQLRMAPTMRAINRSGLGNKNEPGAYSNVE